MADRQATGFYGANACEAIMPLLMILFALLLPRATILLLWLFTQWFEGVFTNALWPILGFLVLPLTMLWYSVVHHWFGGTWGIAPILGLILALVIDLSPATRRRPRTVID